MEDAPPRSSPSPPLPPRRRAPPKARVYRKSSPLHFDGTSDMSAFDPADYPNQEQFYAVVEERESRIRDKEVCILLSTESSTYIMSRLA